ncbi:MAG: hypothetical protein A2X94_03265 [Bdellovibrionales bacterium GWB1_55_8]|nr:MAG: hypothetical protein A2X94_03265 [Bdellovibrionales bacterium GWB1_55_8]
MLIYDGECGFCIRWVARWRALTGTQVTYRPFQEPGILERYGIPRSAAERAVQLIEPTGQKFEGAEAALRALSYARGLRWLAAAARTPLLRPILEYTYGFIARHR